MATNSGSTTRDVSINTKLDHAWKFFELHSNLRVTLLNFYIVLTSLNLTGTGALATAGLGSSFLILVLGLLLVLISFLFWKIDSRISNLIKKSELKLAQIENSVNENDFDLFTEVEEDQVKTKTYWTLGRSLRVVFFVVSLVGIVQIGWFFVSALAG